MNILFYIEPFLELDRPFLHVPWLEFSADMARPLAAAVPGTDIRVLTNAPLAGEAPRFGFAPERVHVIDDRALLQVFGQDYLSATVALYHDAVPEERLDAAAELVRQSVGGVSPDVVITYNTAPFLSRAFPDAVVLHKEYGLYARPPFPKSFYLDPLGKFGHSLLARHAETLRARPLEPGEGALVRAVRSHYCDDIIRRRTPFDRLEAMLRERVRALMLLPLQYGGIYGFNGNGPFRTQGEVLRHVLETVPDDVGVLVTLHGVGASTGEGLVPPELLDWLGRKHGNLIHADWFQTLPNVSQYLLPHVDAVATVSSSVGLQALLWGKTLVALGERAHINALADHQGLDGLGAADLAAPPPDRDGLLAWMLRFYYVPKPYLYDGAWCAAYLEGCVERWRAGQRGLDFLVPFDAPESLARRVIAADTAANPVVPPERPQTLAEKKAALERAVLGDGHAD